MLLSNNGYPKKSKRNLKKKYLETNENQSTVVQNPCDAAKSVLRR